MREIGYKKCNKLYDFPELKVCPFCGKPPKMVVNPYKKNEFFYVKCMNSKCAIQPLTNEYTDVIRAAEAWNKRSTNAESNNSSVQKLVSFRDLKPGDIFKRAHGRKLYMKIAIAVNPCEIYCNAVNMETGKISYIAPNTSTIKIKGTYVEECNG